MICPKCDTHMESMGYGDEVCPNCGHKEYTETIEELEARLHRIKPNPKSEKGPNDDSGRT